MKQARTRKTLSFILCAALIAAMALSTSGCTQQEAAGPKVYKDGDVLGNGATTFQVEVVDKEGNQTKLEVRTDKDNVGDALQEHGLIEGEEGAYGLYVKTVNGITADYDADQTYWAFYIDGQYASTGVAAPAVPPGATNAFKLEK